MKIPFFSVIVPTHKRPAQLAKCVKALTKLDYPQDQYEIIVVNDGGGESQPLVFDETPGPPKITFLNQVNAGPATARNNGARAAKGNYVAFTDDDCIPGPGWLNALEAVFQQWPSALVGGRTLNGLPQNTYSTASQTLILALSDYYNRNPERATFFTSNNFAMPTKGFWSIGGFDESFPMAAAEDRDLCDRWDNQKLPMVYTEAALVRHEHHLTLFGFLAQHFRYGRGAKHYQERRLARSNKTSVEPLSFYWGLLTYNPPQPLRWRRLPVACLILLSQAVNAAGFFWEKLVVRNR